MIWLSLGLQLWGGGPVLAQDVNLRNANFFYVQEDIRVQKPGIALELTRTYNSRSNHHGFFGYGWSSNLDIVCQEGPDGSILITDSDGFVLRYTLEGEPKSRIQERYMDRLAQVRREQDANSGGERNDAYYTDFRARLGSDPDFRQSVSETLADAWSDAVPGTYISFDRGTERLTKRQDNTYVRTRSDGARFRFNRLGQLITFVDPGGRGMRLDYDREGHLVKVAHTEGGSVTLSWDSEDRIAEILDTESRRIQYTYGSRGTLDRVQGPGERQQAYTYDEEFNLNAAREADGEGFQVNYDLERDWVLAFKRGEEVWQYHWQMLDTGHSVRITDPDLRTTDHIFDDSVHRHVEINQAGEQTETLLSECCDKPLEVRHPGGQITRYDYDRQARLVGVEHPDGRRVRFAYHPQWSHIIQAHYSDGRRFLYTYDANGNLVQAASRGGRTLSLAYGAQGKVTEIRDQDGQNYQFRYDVTGRPIQISKGDEGSLGIRYGVMGEIAGTEIVAGDTGRADFYRDLREVLDMLEPATGGVE